jgi:hypothetical protein
MRLTIELRKGQSFGVTWLTFAVRDEKPMNRIFPRVLYSSKMKNEGRRKKESERENCFRD